MLGISTKGWSWITATVVWTAAWGLTTFGVGSAEWQVTALGLFMAIGGATAMSWVIAEYVAGRVASDVAAVERIRVEELARQVALALAQEYDLRRLPKRS